jgi:hypothetical protein
MQTFAVTIAPAYAKAENQGIQLPKERSFPYANSIATYPVFH